MYPNTHCWSVIDTDGVTEQSDGKYYFKAGKTIKFLGICHLSWIKINGETRYLTLEKEIADKIKIYTYTIKEGDNGVITTDCDNSSATNIPADMYIADTIAPVINWESVEVAEKNDTKAGWVKNVKYVNSENPDALMTGAYTGNTLPIKANEDEGVLYMSYSVSGTLKYKFLVDEANYAKDGSCIKSSNATINDNDQKGSTEVDIDQAENTVTATYKKRSLSQWSTSGPSGRSLF